MARKSRKQKLVERADTVHDPITAKSGPPRPAVIAVMVIVLLFLGVTIGVVIDVVMRPAPQRDPAPVGRVRPPPAAPPVVANAPERRSFFDESPGEETAALPTTTRPFSPMVLNAVPADVPESMPVVAIVIDDMGLDRGRSARVEALPAPLTLSFLTYANDLTGQAAAARNAGHEIMAHIPMEPLGNADPGPGALTSEADADEIRARLDAYLDGWTGYVGINNHMGSKLTADRAAMNVVMGGLRDRGLLWLDSRTDAATVGEAAAAALGVPYVGRDVFLDNEDDRAAIEVQLKKVEAFALEQGYAVAIGHPRDNTIAALSEWLPTLERKGIALVPITEVVRRKAL